MARYGAVVDGKQGAYGVIIPDLPGCTAMGKTVDEALAKAAEAARAWAEVARADGVEIPNPRTLEKLRHDPEVAAEIQAGGTLAMVPLILDAGRPVKANLSLDAGLLRRLTRLPPPRG